MEVLKKLLKIVFIAIQWLLSLIAGGVMLVSLVTGSFIAAIVALLAFLAVFPPIQRQWIEPKLPFMQPRGLKVLAALILLIVTLFVSPSPTLARVCQAPEAGKCAEHQDTLDVDQVETAYVVVSFPKSPDAKEAVLELNYTADPEAEAVEPTVVYTATQGLEADGEGSVQFELALNDLPIGAYEAAIAIGDTTVTQDFELTGTPPRLNEVALCGLLAGETCETNFNLYLENAFDALYLTATPQHFRAETPITVAVTYISEPGKSENLNTLEGIIRPEDTGFEIDIPLPAFKVGTYEITLSSSTQDFLSQTETLTVWHNTDAIDVRAEGTLSDSTTPITGFKLCQQQLTDDELAQLNDETPNDETIDIDDSDRCATDETTFPKGTQTLAADVDIGGAFARSETDTVDLTFIWRYLEGPSGSSQELNIKTYPIAPDLSTFVYTLTGPDEGYPAGTYDVTVFLETNTARPIRREFVVE